MLDLGALVARVLFDDAEFQTGYTRVVRQMSELGRVGTVAATGTGKLDASLTTLGRSGTTAAAGIDRTAKSSTAAASAEEKAAAAASRHAQAVARVSTTLGFLTDATDREQAAVLRATAAQERYDELLATGTASTKQLAAAKAGLISATRAVTTAQAAAVTEQEALNTAQVAGAATSRSMLAGLGRTAVELGLLIGGIEIAKKAFEFISAGKDLTDSLNLIQAAARATDAQMLDVRAQAIALGKDLTVPGATAVDAADAILELVKAGILLPRAMEAARPALLLAAATNSKMADTAKVLGDTMDIFSIKGAGAAHAANIIGASVLGASHDLLGFFDAMKQAGPTAQALHISLDDVSASIVYLAKHGLSTSMGGAAIKTFLTNLTKDTPKGIAALHDLGIEAFDAQGRFVGFPKIFDQLHAAYVRFGPDSHRFLQDLNAAFGVRSQSAAALFGKVTGAALDEVHHKLETGDLQHFADVMNRGVGAGFRQLSKEATAAGIDVYQKLEPSLASAVSWLGDKLPGAVSTLAQILGPTIHLIGDGLGGAWHVVAAILGPILGILASVGHFLADNNQIITVLAVTIGTMWAAWKGYTIAIAAISAVRLAVMRFASTAPLALASVGNSVRSAAASFGIMRASVAAVAIGLGIATAIWQASEGIAARNTELIQGYSQALEQDRNRLGEHTRALVVDNLAQSGAYEMALKLGISQKLLTDAVIGVGGAAGRVKAILSNTDAENKNYLAYVAITAVLGGVHGQLAKAIQQQKDKSAADGRSTGEIGKNSDAIVRNTRTTKIANDTNAGYARLMGIVVDKNGEASAASVRVADAIRIMSAAVRAGGTDVQSLVAAMQAYEQSAHGVADRASLIGATLKASNGDALAFAGSLTSVTSAVDGLTQSFKDEQSQLAQQSQSQAQAAGRVTAAQERLNELRAKGKHSASELTSAENSLRDAQAAAAKSGALAYADTMRAAIRFKQTQDGLTASIDTTAKGAPALVQGLQSIQDAGVQAAAAEYQHMRATESGKKAADAAYQLYVHSTRGALIDNRNQLGLNLGQAKALAKEYFGLDGKHVKTLIESEGTDKVVNVLNHIGRLLARVLGKPWHLHVDANTSAAEAKLNRLARQMRRLGAPQGGATSTGSLSLFTDVPGSATTAEPRASGGDVMAGRRYIVGEHQPELFVPKVNGTITPRVPVANGTQQKLIHIDHFTFAPTIMYAEKDKDTEVFPRTQRQAFEQLKSFL